MVLITKNDNAVRLKIELRTKIWKTTEKRSYGIQNDLKNNKSAQYEMREIL